MTTLAPGQLLRGKYRIKKILGQGGMGVVVRATHLRLERDVAIKMLRPKMARDSSIVARFAREARSAARLTGDHVVKVLDVDESEGGAAFLVMEYLEGRDLEAIVRRDGPLEPGRAADYALQALEGLAQAHVLGIVHRDVKPANLFLAKTDRGEVVKLLDFGLAKVLLDVHQTTLTQVGRILGSPLFMSPEQAKASRDVDIRTDLWSMGVVLYFLVSGKLPFKGKTPALVAANITSEAPIPLEELRPDLPPELVEVVRHCMEKDRSKRYASAAEVASALAPFVPRGAEAAERIAKILETPPQRTSEPELSVHGLPFLPGTDPGATTSLVLGADAPGRVDLPKIPGTDPGTSSREGATRPEGPRASSRPPVPNEKEVEKPPEPVAAAPSAPASATRSRALLAVVLVLAFGAIAVLAWSGGRASVTRSSPAAPEPADAEPE